MINMGIIKKLLGKTHRSNRVTTLQRQSGDASHPESINQQLENIYGREKIELQILYENWVVKDTWLLKHEAMPLLLGVNPESNIKSLPSDVQNNIEQLWVHAKNCVDQGLLRLINPEKDWKDWRVNPLDIYRWARVSRIDLPDVFSTLMEFVSNTIKQPELPQKSYSDTENNENGCENFDQNREKVLGIALALLAAYPEKCTNSRGKVKVDKIVNLINEKGEFWLGNETLDLSTVAIRDLIGKWLDTLPASNDING